MQFIYTENKFFQHEYFFTSFYVYNILHERQTHHPPEHHKHVVALGGDGGVLGVPVTHLDQLRRGELGAPVHSEVVVAAVLATLQVEVGDVELHAGAQLCPDLPPALHRVGIHPGVTRGAETITRLGQDPTTAVNNPF